MNAEDRIVGSYKFTKKLLLDDVYVTSHGSKLAKIKDGDDEAFLITKFPVYSPFSAGTFDKDPTATRLNLHIALTDAGLEELVRMFDSWVVDWLQQHSEMIFKKPMTRDQVLAGYTSCIREPKTPGMNPLLKCKIDTQGRYALCCWDKATGQRIEPPASWAGVHAEVKIHFSHLWFMGAQFGAVIRITDAIIHPGPPEVSRANPFV